MTLENPGFSTDFPVAMYIVFVRPHIYFFHREIKDV